ncbi:MAG: tetratricopeptide repeat protein [Terriglobia bacterium]
MVSRGLCPGSSSREQNAYEQGLYHMKKGNLSQAEKAFREALEDPATQANASYQLALIYIKRGFWGDAEASVREFHQAQNQSAEGYYVLGFCLFKQGRYRLSVEAFEKSLSLEDNHVSSSFRMAYMPIETNTRG